MIKIQILLVLCCIISIEFLQYFNIQSKIKDLNTNISKVYNLISAKYISDLRKEKMVPFYAFIILKNSLKVFVLLLSIVLIFLIPELLNASLIYFIMSPLGLLESFIISFVYFRLRD